jgi:hypothetical protein
LDINGRLATFLLEIKALLEVSIDRVAYASYDILCLWLCEIGRH